MKTKPKILITGAPGVGKTTLIQRVLDQLGDFHAAGFLTEERRDHKGRSGIVLRTLDGREVQIATSGKGRGNRVGKYQVDVDAFETIALEVIAFHPEVALYVIDEIGPMETLSRTFNETTRMLLRSDKTAVLASVSKQGHGFIRDVKRMLTVEVIEVTEENREVMVSELATLLRATLSATTPPAPAAEPPPAAPEDPGASSATS